MSKKTITVIGLGYIGLPTAVILAHHGYSVNGIDNSQHVIDNLTKGKAHINEPDIDHYLKTAIKKGLINVSKEIKRADIYMICVPTPLINGKIPKPDLSSVMDAANKISSVIKDGDIVVLESTCPVGTTDEVFKIVTKNETADIHMAYCPERVMPGNIIKELSSNARIVGGVNDESTKTVATFYSTFVDGVIHQSDSKTAEMCKLSENSYRDVNIAYANEISILCEKYDINTNELIRLANYHPRVNILSPGIGVGGHCIAVDPWFLISSNSGSTALLQEARNTNLNKTQTVIDTIIDSIDHFEIIYKDRPKIAFFGLSYKPDSDDLRCAPAIDIVQAISKLVNIMIVEPNLTHHSKFELHKSEYAIKNSDLCIFLVRHSTFVSEFSSQIFEGKKVIDFCGVTDETTSA